MGYRHAHVEDAQGLSFEAAETGSFGFHAFAFVLAGTTITFGRSCHGEGLL